MRKTKIVCTLGPATDREGVLRQMLEAGMNVARFNFSHGSHAEHKGRLDARRPCGRSWACGGPPMLDTKGPEVRLKSLRRRFRHAADRPGVHPDHPGHRGG